MMMILLVMGLVRGCDEQAPGGPRLVLAKKYTVFSKYLGDVYKQAVSFFSERLKCPEPGEAAGVGPALRTGRRSNGAS